MLAALGMLWRARLNSSAPAPPAELPRPPSELPRLPGAPSLPMLRARMVAATLPEELWPRARSLQWLPCMAVIMGLSRCWASVSGLSGSSFLGLVGSLRDSTAQDSRRRGDDESACLARMRFVGVGMRARGRYITFNSFG